MDKTKILSDKKYGIMVHYLASLQNGKYSPRNPSGITTDWNECVKDFDVEAFAKSVNEAGAGYVLFTLCQCTANICAPNKAFEEITDHKCTSACSERDLPLDLAIALKKYGIDLYLYFTGDGPQRDETASKAFGTLNHTNNKVSEAFVKKWSSVMKEFSLRYGDLVKGWWIDAGFD